MKKLSLLLALIVSTASLSFAKDAASAKKVVVPASDCLFRANEWQVDAAVDGSAGLNGNNTKQAIGGDLGINYFWSKYFGIGIDNAVGGVQTVGQSGSQGYDRVLANLFVRYPICAWNLAPYAMVGGGAYWDASASQGEGSVGGGVEYRFTQNIGCFADCRWLYGSNSSSSISIANPRVGVRFIF